MTSSYALMDTDTFNMVGSFRSRAAALPAYPSTYGPLRRDTVATNPLLPSFSEVKKGTSGDVGD